MKHCETSTVFVPKSLEPGDPVVFSTFSLSHLTIRSSLDMTQTKKKHTQKNKEFSTPSLTPNISPPVLPSSLETFVARSSAPSPPRSTDPRAVEGPAPAARRRRRPGRSLGRRGGSKPPGRRPGPGHDMGPGHGQDGVGTMR